MNSLLENYEAHLQQIRERVRAGQQRRSSSNASSTNEDASGIASTPPQQQQQQQLRASSPFNFTGQPNTTPVVSTSVANNSVPQSFEEERAQLLHVAAAAARGRSPPQQQQEILSSPPHSSPHNHNHHSRVFHSPPQQQQQQQQPFTSSLNNKAQEESFILNEVQHLNHSLAQQKRDAAERDLTWAERFRAVKQDLERKDEQIAELRAVEAELKKKLSSSSHDAAFSQVSEASHMNHIVVLEQRVEDYEAAVRDAQMELEQSRVDREQLGQQEELLKQQDARVQELQIRLEAVSAASGEWERKYCADNDTWDEEKRRLERILAAGKAYAGNTVALAQSAYDSVFDICGGVPSTVSSSPAIPTPADFSAALLEEQRKALSSSSEEASNNNKDSQVLMTELLQRATAHMYNLSSELQSTKAVLNEMQSAQEDLMENFDASTTDLEERDKKVTRLETDLVALRQELKEDRKEKDRLQDEKRQLNQFLSDAELKQHEAAQQLQVAKLKLAQAEATLLELRSEQQTAHEHTSIVELQMQSRLKTRTAELQVAHTDLDSLRQDFDTAQETVASLRQTIESLQEKNSKLTTDARQFVEQNERLTTELKEELNKLQEEKTQLIVESEENQKKMLALEDHRPVVVAVGTQKEESNTTSTSSHINATPASSFLSSSRPSTPRSGALAAAPLSTTPTANRSSASMSLQGTTTTTTTTLATTSAQQQQQRQLIQSVMMERDVAIERHKMQISALEQERQMQAFKWDQERRRLHAHIAELQDETEELRKRHDTLHERSHQADAQVRQHEHVLRCLSEGVSVREQQQ